jgi:pimeloyl-ACP methyl ester carboxylesterase
MSAISTPSTARPHVGALYPQGWRSRVPPAWLEGWSSEAFDLGDGTTEVVTMGEGPTLLLLPPLPGFKEAFLALARPLARRHRVVTFDLRARFTGPPSWDVLLDDLERITDAFAPGTSIVFGHSLGSALAMRWATRRPERVSALILSSPFARTRAPGVHSWKRWVEQPAVLASLRWLPEVWSRRLARGYARRGAWVFDAACQGAVADLVGHGIRHMPIGVARQCVRLAFAHDERATLPRIEKPTLLVVGERETAWSRAAEAEVAALMPRAQRLVSPGAAHLHPLSAPAFLADEVLAWLARIEAGVGGAGPILGSAARA